MLTLLFVTQSVGSMTTVKRFYVTYKHEKSVRVEMVYANSYEEAWLKILAKMSPEETMRTIELTERVYA